VDVVAVEGDVERAEYELDAAPIGDEAQERVMAALEKDLRKLSEVHGMDFSLGT
jgi:hypothetical protein